LENVSGISGEESVYCSSSDSGRTGKDFPKYGAPGSILSGHKWWPLPAYVMMLSHFSHNQRTPVQISLQYLHWC